MMGIVIVLALMLLGAAWRWLRNRPAVIARWPRRPRMSPDGWEAVRGMLPGAAVGALIFPITPFLVTIAWFVAHSRWHSVSIGTAILDTVNGLGGVLGLFVVAGIVWWGGMALTLPLWNLLCWRRLPGPWIAEALSAGLAMLVLWLAPFLTVTAPLLSVSRPLAELAIGLAGGACAATTWWATYQPGVLRSRVRLCPILACWV